MQRLDDRGFGGAIDLADEILRPFRGDLQQVDVARAAVDDAAGAARSLPRGGEHRMHEAHSTRGSSDPGTSMASPLDRVRIVLCATSHPGNIGATALAMRTMGLSQLVLVAPREFPHPDADALAASGVTLLRTARIVPTLDDALAGATLAIGFSARRREFASAAMPVRGAALEAAKHAAAGEVALVFGTEMSGLSNEELARCQIVATIPGVPGLASLNLAAAVQVAAYELFLAVDEGAVWTAPAFKPATQEEIAALFAHGERT